MYSYTLDRPTASATFDPAEELLLEELEEMVQPRLAAFLTGLGTGIAVAVLICGC